MYASLSPSSHPSSIQQSPVNPVLRLVVYKAKSNRGFHCHEATGAATGTSKTTGSLTAKLAAPTSTPKMHHLAVKQKPCSSAPRPWEARSRLRDILASANSVKRQNNIGVGRRVWM
ncbi:hypothetical protein I7I51_06915 [Histoplasma capsulatum]|uniref:Uncharacterized protein n=1 Tax=Ajellomyces capsulatus TaxID=5037 RepID=A0A8A1MMY8_AJECA|nr:hypothetical protein I7I51_06915 [Histoplasma capsulatum]